MKILIYGAGIIGSIYASRLFEANQNVTLLARGQKHTDLKENGICLKNGLTGEKIISKVPLISELNRSDFYDLIIVAVRLDQLESTIPNLHENKESPLILFMLNNPDDIADIQRDLPNKHVVLGFPGVGGTLNENQIDFVEIKQQKTTIGEIDGVKSETVTNLKALFESAGFKTDISLKIQDWLKTHAVFICCITASIVNANGDSVKLAKNKSSIRNMIQSIKEGFEALEDLNITIEPANLKVIFTKVPKWFSRLYWQKAMRSDLGKLAIAPHAMVATKEMQLVAQKILAIIRTSSVPTPTFNKLLSTFIKSN